MVETLFDAVSKKTLKKKRVVSSQSGSGSDTDSASSAGEEHQTLITEEANIPHPSKNNASKKADLKLKIKNVRGLCKWVNLLLTMRFSKRRQSVSFEKLIQPNRHTYTFVMLVSRDVTIDQL